jgi:polyphosphate kinase
MTELIEQETANLQSPDVYMDLANDMPYMDREISWLKFNQRVLTLANNPEIPLLERVKFLSITSSNLDEFFAIRVASRVKHQDDDNEDEEDVSDTVLKIIRKCWDMTIDIDKTYFTLLTSLAEKNINISTEFDRTKVFKYFTYNIKPALAPLAIDTTRPLPHLKPLSIYIILFVKGGDGNERIGLIEIPNHLNRIIKIGKNNWYFIEDMIMANIHDLYPGAECSDLTAFRVIRDGDTDIVDDDKSYVESMIMHARGRILYNTPIRLDILAKANTRIVSMLRSSLDIKRRSVFVVNSRLKMSDIMELYKASNDPTLKYPAFKPADPVADEEKTFMNVIGRKDVMVHHPYESFNDSVLRFIREASEDPHVISIKQTLYRSGEDSKIVRHLIRAAESGKNVTVVMELKARFDEETNIEWANKLQRAGATVVYGYEDIKTHAKLLHVFRKKGKNAEQFCHIGTGNYSEKNSKIYTDFSYFTSNKKTCSDINNIFNMLTGGLISENIKFHNLYIAPLAIRSRLYELIDLEIAKGTEGYIAIKINNISDEQLIKKLYTASNAGVKIEIVCRTSCSLVPNVPGYSENITVTSVVGRFLEHGRVMLFGRDVDQRVFITSADLMTRNLDRRIEILFGITNSHTKSQLKLYMNTMISDEFNTHMMGSDGRYIKRFGNFDSQSTELQTVLPRVNHIQN